jgi:hypothetical protein
VGGPPPVQPGRSPLPYQIKPAGDSYAVIPENGDFIRQFCYDVNARSERRGSYYGVGLTCGEVAASMVRDRTPLTRSRALERSDMRGRLGAIAVGGVVCGALAFAAGGLTSVRLGKQADGSFVVSSGQRVEPGAIAFDGRPIDLARGRVVEAVSHSPPWKETCIFVSDRHPLRGTACSRLQAGR